MVCPDERMLKLHAELPRARTPHDEELIERQVSATDKQIDSLGYELCGLTDDEIAIVGTERSATTSFQESESG